MNSLTVNLHLMMVSFFRPDAQRNRILIEKSAFPSDRYAVVSQLAFHGLNAAEHLIEIEPRPGERTLRTEDVIDRIEQEGSRPGPGAAARRSISHRAGLGPGAADRGGAPRRRGGRRGSRARHRQHAAETARLECRFRRLVQLQVSQCGPGRRRRLLRARTACAQRRTAAICRLVGARRGERDFKWDPSSDRSPAPRAGRSAILRCCPWRRCWRRWTIFQQAGFARLREKSIALTGYLQHLIEQRLPGLVDCITPRRREARGCQLSLRIGRPPAAAKRCHDLLTAAGVVGDWREPDVLRLAPIPLYNSYATCSPRSKHYRRPCAGERWIGV